MRFLFILFLFLAGFSCQTSKSLNAGPSSEASLVMSMKKTACYGTCPVYSIQIYSDLTVTLKGERHIDNIGDFVATIEKEKLALLTDQFRKSDFFSFEEEYKKAITDLPTTYVYFADAGNTKEVMDYYGAPQSLRDLEEELANLLEELDWKKVQD